MFQPGERQRQDSLVGLAAADAERMSTSRRSLALDMSSTLLRRPICCRSFVRACLFQPGERQRLDSLVGLAGADAERMTALQRAAPVELAVHAASSGSWDR